MEFFKRYWTQIRAQLEGLSASQKWAISTTLVLGLLLVGIAVIIAGQPDRVPISAFASGRSEEVLARLQAAGIDATRDGGQIVVPYDQQERAIGLLVQGDLLTADTSEAFSQLIERQSPWQSNDQNAQAYLLAKQRVLGQIVGKMRGVRNASVLISMPQDKGFGRTHIRPSASVTVWMHGSGRVSDAMVDAVARLVAGSVAEMQPQDVSITDGNFGRTRTVKDEDDILPTETLELLHKIEEYHRNKIDKVLAYIPGVIVAVNVQMDDVQKQQEVNYDYEKAQPLSSEELEEITRKDVRDSGEPGPRPNTGMSIAGSTGGGVEENISRSRTEFRDKPLVSERHVTKAGRQVQRINVSINVPRRYFLQIFKANNPDVESPDDQTMQTTVQEQLTRIQDQVEPLILAEVPGVVKAHMVPDETLVPMAAQSLPSGGLDAVLVSDWVKPVSVGLLALLSVALMLGMVRKATQPEPLPSIEELAGVPPMLAGDGDVVGEADDGDAAMAGVELDDDELQSRRIAEQISELIKANPAEAGNLLGRWVRHED